jgi:hypothetical protein
VLCRTGRCRQSSRGGGAFAPSFSPPIQGSFRPNSHAIASLA